MNKLLAGVGVAVGLSVLLLFGMKNLQENFIFLPEELPQDYEFRFDKPFEEKFFEPEGDVVVHGLHFKAENPKGIILYFHGNAGSLRQWGMVSEDFVPLGYDILVVDYRTYGKSRGPLSEEALHKDAEYIFEHLKEEWDESQIIPYGRSLGTGIALRLGTRFNPEKILLETPYYNFKELAHNHMPFIPTSLLLQYTFRNDEWIQKTDAKVYMVHGTNDEIVPYQHSVRLSQYLDNPEEQHWTVEGGNHNNLGQFDEYRRFLRTVLR